MSIIGIKQDKATQNEKAQDKARAATGEACAHNFVKAIREQANSLKRFLEDVSKMDIAGRKAFRVALSGELKEIRVQLKASEGTAKHATWKQAGRSYGVRISEAVTFSKACDAGVTFDFGRNYHALIGDARIALASNGQGSTRGRKATSALDKIKAFVLKLEADGQIKHSQLKDAALMLETMAKVSASKAVNVETKAASKGTVVMMPTPAAKTVQAAVNTAANDSMARAAAASKADKPQALV